MGKFPVHNRPIDFSSTAEEVFLARRARQDEGRWFTESLRQGLEQSTLGVTACSAPTTATEAMLHQEEAVVHLASMYGFPSGCLGTCQPQRSTRKHVDSRIISKPKLLT